MNVSRSYPMSSDTRFVELLQSFGGALDQQVDYSCPIKLSLRKRRSGLVFKQLHKSTLYGVLVNEARNKYTVEDAKEFAECTANYIVECCHPALHAVPKFEILKLSAAKHDYFKALSIHRELIEHIEETLHDVVLAEMTKDKAI